MEEEKKYVCEYCGKDDFENHHQFNGHRMACKAKHDPKEKSASREKRVPFGVPIKRFNCPEDDDKYHYRVFNDNWRKEPGRIRRAKNAGYEIVDHEITGMSVGSNDDGSEIKAVLMRLPKELYDADQALKHKELDKIDEQIYRGEFAKEKGEKRYLPGGGIQMKT
jgi:hypothetical protein